MDFLPHAIIFLTEAAAAAVSDMMERNWKIIEQTRRGLCRGWNAARQEIPGQLKGKFIIKFIDTINYCPLSLFMKQR